LQFVDVSRDHIFGGIEMYARPRAELLDYVEKRNHIFNRIGQKGAVIGVPLAGQVEAAWDDVVSFARGGEPSNERFNHQVEEKGR
jgi:hypothetical protein